MSRASENNGAVESGIPPHGLEAAKRPLEAVAPPRAWAADPREQAARLRARRWALLLMAASSLAAIALLVGAWLVLRQFN